MQSCRCNLTVHLLWGAGCAGCCRRLWAAWLHLMLLCWGLGRRGLGKRCGRCSIWEQNHWLHNILICNWDCVNCCLRFHLNHCKLRHRLQCLFLLGKQRLLCLGD
ncbi:hypothetical protein V8C86DRAFT_2528410 [Haematococcus lacustris]